MSRRTTTYTSNEQSAPAEAPTEVLVVVAEPETELVEVPGSAAESTDVESTEAGSTDAGSTDVGDATAATTTTAARPALHRKPGRTLPPGRLRRPALYLAVAAAGAILVNVYAVGEPDAQADPATDTVSVAEQLDLSAQETAAALTDGELSDRLAQLAANRSQREAEQLAAVQAQAAADQAVRDAQAAEAARLAAEAKAAEDARLVAEAAAAEQARAAEEAAAAAEEAAAEESSSSTSSSSSASTGSGSYQDYALAQLGGDTSEFSCLEKLWGKESGWDPDAQNPTSTAYGIPQFLDSTWKSTGIAKTSDGYRQIDAGLIYIDSRYGSPCAAWAHSQSKGWY